MKTWPNPFIEQRADPYILRHQDSYYFIARCRSMTVWKSAAHQPLKVYATRSRWSSGVNRTAAR